MKRVLLCALLMGWSAMASAVVYKWVDAQGKLQYGDRPPDGVHAEVVEMLGVHAARSAGTSSTSASGAKSSSAPGDNAPTDTKKAVDNDVAQTREKQCAEAQDRYQKLIEGRRLYKTGDNGERQYLTSEEVDSERLNAKRDIDTICNSAT